MDRPFEEFKPSQSEPFDLKRLCHLLRRTSFGVTPARIMAAKGKPPSEVVDSLLNYDPANDPFDSMIAGLEGFVNLTDQRSVASYWFYRMLNSPHPMQERIALFWHGRWATGSGKVDNGR